jgi:photosystem II stability/assembly factor-like uncharacterized protein
MRIYAALTKAGSVVAIAAILFIAMHSPANTQEGSWRRVGYDDGFIWGADCADSMNCMIAVRLGIGIESHISRSTDGGVSWSKVMIDTGSLTPHRWPLLLYDLAFPTRSLVMVAADSGWIHRSVDGGETWAKLRIASVRKPVLKLSMADSLHGLAVVDYPNRLFLTHDGGASWQEVASSEVRPKGSDEWPIVEAIQTGPRSLVCIFQDSLNQVPSRSTDAGETWTHGGAILPQFPDAAALRASFIDSLRGWATSRHRFSATVPPRGIILRTTDGGLRWTIMHDSIHGGVTTVISAIAFRDESNGIVDGYYDIYRTSDGGVSWSVDYDDSLRGISRLVYRVGTPGFAFGATDDIFRYEAGSASAVAPVRPSKPTLLTAELRPLVVSTELKLSLTIYSHSSGVAGVSIHSLLGELVAAPMLVSLYGGTGTVQVRVDHLAAGTYFVVIESEGVTRSARFHIVR